MMQKLKIVLVARSINALHLTVTPHTSLHIAPHHIIVVVFGRNNREENGDDGESYPVTCNDDIATVPAVVCTGSISYNR